MTSSFESFYAGTAPRLLRYAYGLTGDMAEAQDFTQEAYARAWPRWKRLQRYDNPESWLRLVVSRLAVDRLRWLGARRARPHPESGVVPPPNEEMLTIVAALKGVPLAQRKALVLHYFLDLPVAEIAAETGTNVNTVKTWLARGRLNVAAQLAEGPPATHDLQGVRKRVARRRRNRTVSSSIAAFLATATAAAIAFFTIPDAVPPSLRPDLVVPYAGQPRMALPLVVGQRAVTVWQDTDGQARLGAIDLSTGRKPWDPLSLGRFDDSLFPLGVSRDGIMVLAGVNDSSQADDFTLLGVDLGSGTVKWKRPPQRHGGPLVDIRVAVTGGGRWGETGIFAVTDETAVHGIDPRTGQPAWAQTSAPKTEFAVPDGNRLAQIQPDGVLRLLDVSTGQVIGERSGLPRVEGRSATLVGDWLYLSDKDGVSRIRVAGSEPASRLADGGHWVQRCGKHVCVNGQNFVAAYHAGSGKELWRKEIRRSDSMNVGQAGIIMTIPGTGPKDEWGSAPDDRQVILDPDGRDITPASLGGRKAYWIDNETLIFEREVVRAVATGPEAPARSVELSVYSLATGVERPMGGQHQLIGGCAGTPGKYVCAGEKGFVLFS